jgi:phosphoribosylaminoimidazole-succinocarboxamide synthase
MQEEYKEIIKKNLDNTIESGHIPALGEHYKGKVRDVHFIEGKEPGKKIVMIASDRISVFDHVLDKQVPFKGIVLNRLNTWAFENSKDIVKNASLESPHPSVLVQKYCKNIMVECVVRGFVWGSMAAEYEQGKREVCGVALPEGMLRYQKLDEPVFTPTTKSEHDEPITFEKMKELVGEETALKAKEISIKLFKRASELAKKQGLVFIDTKYEFGLDENGELTLIDEANTPDSSRYCKIEEYKKFEKIKQEMQSGNYKDVSELIKEKPQLKISELSKQFVRDVITEKGFSYGSEGEIPKLEEEDVIEVSYRYIKLYEILTGQKFEFPKGNLKEELNEKLKQGGYL